MASVDKYSQYIQQAEKAVKTVFPASVFDIHTHLSAPQPGRIICIDPTEGVPTLLPGQYYSVGIHPWNVAKATTAHLDAVRLLAQNPQVLAIGEIGLDTLHATDAAFTLSAQNQLAQKQIEISEQVGKPVIWHIVRRWDDLLALKKAERPTQPWIIHGFRGNPTLADQLTRAGILLSLGPKANPDVRNNFPHFTETDAQP